MLCDLVLGGTTGRSFDRKDGDALGFFVEELVALASFGFCSTVLRISFIALRSNPACLGSVSCTGGVPGLDDDDDDPSTDGPRR